ncbi:unnamed protein product, partial [Darwinula stevensoni]
TESGILLDPDILREESVQALVLNVLATLVRNSSDEAELRILYQYLAEASVVFSRVFSVMYVLDLLLSPRGEGSGVGLAPQPFACPLAGSNSLLDAKITSVLSLCHDAVILGAVQAIIQNMVASEDASLQSIHYLQSIGFGGLWRFAGPFSKFILETGGDLVLR